MDASPPPLTSANLASVLSTFTGVTVAVSAGGFLAGDSSYSQEVQLVANAVESRRREFFSGRHHARQALSQIGYAAAPILKGEKGNPLWPVGVLGSITHDLDQVVVAVMPAGDQRGFGIDLVLDPTRIEATLQPLIARPDELAKLSTTFTNVPSLALAFSVKESAVKAISPTIDCYLDLMDIELSVMDGKISAYLAQFNVHIECGFIALPNGLFSFALLKK